jgi:hypothetical protein
VFRFLEPKHTVMLQENPFRRGVQALTIGIRIAGLHWWSPMSGEGGKERVQWASRICTGVPLQTRFGQLNPTQRKYDSYIWPVITRPVGLCQIVGRGGPAPALSWTAPKANPVRTGLGGENERFRDTEPRLLCHHDLHHNLNASSSTKLRDVKQKSWFSLHR